MASKLQSGIAKLSERAQAILHRLLDQSQPPESIARVLFLQTRESVSPAAITRYASRYRKHRQAQQAVQQTMDGFIARVQQDGIQVSELLRAVLIEKLSRGPRDSTIAKLDLFKLEAAERLRSAIDLRREQAALTARHKERDLDLKERHANIEERRFQLEREKARANFEKLERKAAAGRPLTLDDIRKIKEIYGIYEEGTSGFGTRDSRLAEEDHAQHET
jgi:hypothetical protein